MHIARVAVADTERPCWHGLCARSAENCLSCCRLGWTSFSATVQFFIHCWCFEHKGLGHCLCVETLTLLPPIKAPAGQLSKFSRKIANSKRNVFWKDFAGKVSGVGRCVQFDDFKCRYVQYSKLPAWAVKSIAMSLHANTSPGCSLDYRLSYDWLLSVQHHWHWRLLGQFENVCIAVKSINATQTKGKG